MARKKKMPDPEQIMQDTLELLETSTNNLKSQMKERPEDFKLQEQLANNVRALAQLTKEIRIWKKENLKKWLERSVRERVRIAATYISSQPSGYFREAMQIIMESHPSVRMDKKWKEEAQKRALKKTMNSSSESLANSKRTLIT